MITTARPEPSIRAERTETMTQEQKVEWLAKANSKELIEQLVGAVRRMSNGSFLEMVEGNEDYGLIEAELLKRLG